MKPTISNAFNDETDNQQAKVPGETSVGQPSGRASQSPGTRRPNPRRSLASSLASMQADLRETDFGWSLELSPIHAIDALAGLMLPQADKPALNFLTVIEQCTWRDGGRDGERATPISDIALRLSIPVVENVGPNQLVLAEDSLRQLVSLCQPSRVLVVMVDGPLDAGDIAAINRAIDEGKSPLFAELRALCALEVLGDRSAVLHSRDKANALALTAENFRHYLAALHDRSAACFEAPQPWQIERLIGVTGALTVRPIETQVFSTSIDVGVNTSRERFDSPATRSLIYDIPSNSWHDEP